jgi:hypothetical protein
MYLPTGDSQMFFLAEDAPLAVFACDGLVRVLSSAQLNRTAQGSTARHGTAKSNTATARHSTVDRAIDPGAPSQGRLAVSLPVCTSEVRQVLPALAASARSA